MPKMATPKLRIFVYSGVKVRFRFDQYTNRRRGLCLTLHNLLGDPYVTVTVNLTDPLEGGELAIKNYSENEGMLDWLLTNEVCQRPHRYIRSGFVTCPIVRLTDSFIQNHWDDNPSQLRKYKAAADAKSNSAST